MCKCGRKQRLKSGAEYDLLYAKGLYCYLRNGKRVKHNLKKQMNRRYRREITIDTQTELINAS